MDNEVAALQLADDLVSCRLPPEDSEEKELRKIVSEVQKHKHTKSCTKYNGSCRYGFPRLPSPRTLLAKPLEQTNPDMDEKERSEKKKRAAEVLSTAKTLLEDPNFDEAMKIEDFYTAIGTNEKEYLECLSISERGRVLVLKRDLKERNINNYNPEMILAWNANMDIQLVVDPYAVISYIASYMNKDENSTTPFMKEALSKNAGKEAKEKLKALREAYLTHRQVGASEAAYRAIPAMKMKDSNISCIFVTTGFPNNRSVFFKKLKDEFDDEFENYLETENEMEQGDEGSDSESEEQSEHQKPPPRKKLKIDGRPGLYEESITVHLRYSNRPRALEAMCLAQFATSYVYTSRIPKRIIFDEGCSTEFSNQTIFGSEKEFLPKYISLGGDLGKMRLRAFPAVLRIHSSKKKVGHEKEYAELLLFLSWRDEVKELHPEEEVKCIEKYGDKLLEIQDNREAIFPGERTINLLDNEDLEIHRPAHLCDMLDTQGDQENEDDLAIGAEDDPQFESFSYTGNLAKEGKVSFETSKYRIVKLPNIDEMNFITRRLVPEQMNILRRVVEFCKDVLKSKKNIHHVAKALRLIIHGGAGNKLIESILNLKILLFCFYYFRCWKECIDWINGHTC